MSTIEVKMLQQNRLDASSIFPVKLWKQTKNCTNLSEGSTKKLGMQVFFANGRKHINLFRSYWWAGSSGLLSRGGAATVFAVVPFPAAEAGGGGPSVLDTSAGILAPLLLSPPRPFTAQRTVTSHTGRYVMQW